MPLTNSVRRFWLAHAITPLLLFFGAQSAFAEVMTAPPVPPGFARVWIYRDYEPYVTLATPYVRMNGAIVAISQPGGSFYRDVPPGTYLVAVDSDGYDVYQFAQAVLAPGQAVYIKIEASPWWWSSRHYRRDTFYTRVVEPQSARSELAAQRRGYSVN